MTTVAWRLHDLRERATRATGRRLSRLGLSKIADLAESQVGVIEAGTRDNYRSDVLTKLCTTLACSMDYLVRGIGDPPSDEDIAAAVSAARLRFGDELPVDEEAEVTGPEAA